MHSPVFQSQEPSFDLCEQKGMNGIRQLLKLMITDKATMCCCLSVYDIMKKETQIGPNGRFKLRNYKSSYLFKIISPKCGDGNNI